MLEAARALSATSLGRTELFKVVPLGGVWTARNRGVAFDAYQGRSVGADTALFCERYRLQKAARFDTSLYSIQGALSMARAWCARMTFFFRGLEGCRRGHPFCVFGGGAPEFPRGCGVCDIRGDFDGASRCPQARAIA